MKKATYPNADQSKTDMQPTTNRGGRYSYYIGLPMKKQEEDLMMVDELAKIADGIRKDMGPAEVAELVCQICDMMEQHAEEDEAEAVEYAKLSRYDKLMLTAREIYITGFIAGIKITLEANENYLIG